MNAPATNQLSGSRAIKPMYSIADNASYTSKWYFLKDEILCGSSRDQFLKRIADSYEIVQELKEKIASGDGRITGVMLVPRVEKR